jgi:hypothetical protein
VESKDGLRLDLPRPSLLDLRLSIELARRLFLQRRRWLLACPLLLAAV